jgi:hypothetical protein
VLLFIDASPDGADYVDAALPRNVCAFECSRDRGSRPCSIPG